MNPINEEESSRISMDALQNNMKQIDVTRSFLCIVGGVITGILGCTGFNGFLCFVLLYLSLALSIGLKINFDYMSYMHCTLTSFLLTDLQKNGLSFILFWTLTYALIYIY
mmetsp:Transcript_17009/g.28373  ORF Transcript_17009/g.28373 Transcript_17009/m.28373 type:complete len:110 (+) Transcript_17009:144-473(+)|eukprot:CAMPEP_0114432046 /NCGR_PEP_ID=MMETSP0103-20121206/10941_1 /TAXON_ID=37642 ORGANISM="Paraphysomonas imperforata, Strain PA2" /NCGR_SAMPLE_ID=MMETSP0103 /ASSEMBLY_ACC=CAM_ASM_000201 /LENGTH=109 /DNA_ID=CAMNT_0001601685 /DNA_START=139 /DNA_END=468 /DNA_ORIENTATION=+